MTKSRIMVYGSYAVGMTMGCDKFPTAGQTVPGSNFQQFHGGKGSNQAIAAARLGGDVCFVSCVGADSLGDAAMQLFHDEGLDVKVKRSSDNATDVGFVMVESTGENRIIINFGASMEVNKADIDSLEGELKKSKILLMQMEADIATMTYAAQKAQENGVMVIFNPAPYREMPEALIKNIDIITPNESEAKELLGIAAKQDVAAEELGQQLQGLGIPHVVITLGGEGALLCSEGKIKRIGVKNKVKAVDTTGAGDTFAGALAVAISEGNTYEQAVIFANQAASISVTRSGVIEGIPYRNELVD